MRKGIVMGTRCVTNVIDEKGNVYVNLYRQYDGYPDGHGKELAEWLTGAEIGNGIGSSVSPKFFNGVGDLALRLVTFFRQDHTQIGSFYIIPLDTDWGQEFTYTVKVVEGSEVKMKVEGYSGVLFQGTAEEFNEWINKTEEEF